MDNIFDIYSAKVDNDKVTEWDSYLLFPNLAASIPAAVPPVPPPIMRTSKICSFCVRTQEERKIRANNTIFVRNTQFFTFFLYITVEFFFATCKIFWCVSCWDQKLYIFPTIFTRIYSVYHLVTYIVPKK